MEVENLRGKISTLESVLKQMRDASERKKELERQQQSVQDQLRQREAALQATEVLGHPSAAERQTAAAAVQALRSTLRELEKKAEVQSLRHEELMLEMSAIKKQSKTRNWIDGSPEGTVTPDSSLLFNGSTARSSPLGTAITPASLEAPTEVVGAPDWTSRPTDIQLPVTSGRLPVRPAGTGLDLDGIMAKIHNDNKILAELDKNRSNIGIGTSASATGTSKRESSYSSTLTSSLGISSSETKPANRARAFTQSGQMTTSHQSGLLSHSGLASQSVPTSQSGMFNHSGISGQTGLNTHSVIHNASGGVLSHSGVLGVGLGSSGLLAQPELGGQLGLLRPLGSQTAALTNPAAAAAAAAAVSQPSVLSRPALYGQPTGPAQPTLLTAHISQQPALLTAQQLPLKPLTSVGDASFSDRQQQQRLGLSALQRTGRLDAVNGLAAGLLGTNAAHLAANAASVAQLPAALIDVLEVPGKGKCQVHVARFSYDPFQHSPNEAPESELRLAAGDPVLVWGDMDEDGFLDGEMLDGRRGLVPSNYVTKLVGAELLAFHRRLTERLGGRGGAEAAAGGRRGAVSRRSAEDPGEAAALRHRLAQRRLSDHGRRPARVVPELRRAQSFRYERSSDGAALCSAADDPRGNTQPHVGFDLDPGVLSDEAERDFRVDPAMPAVPPPRQLTVERQLHKSVLLGWTAADAGAGEMIDNYHVFVDGLLRCTVSATELCRALLEGVDLTRRHRLTVRSVTPDGRTSAAAACTLVIGRDVAPAPTAVRATHVTATSAIIGWMPSNSNCHHTVCVNRVEVRTVAPGVHRHTITGLSPNMVYRVTVKVKNVVPQHLSNGEINYRQRLETHIEFRTLPKGVPEPPVGVQCEWGPQEGCVLVTWLPVTISTNSGTSNGLPVTGYAVYADGQKVTELNSPTGDHAVIDLKNIRGFQPRQVTVRTKSRDLISGDSLPCMIPQRANGKVAGDGVIRGRPVDQSGRDLTSGQPAGQPGRQTQQRLMETEDDFSDREAEFDKFLSYKGYDDFNGRHQPSNGHSGRSQPYDIHAPWNDERRPAAAGAAIRPVPGSAPGHQRGHPRADLTGPDSGYSREGRHATNSSSGPQGSYSERHLGPRDQRMRVFVALFDYDPTNMSPNVDSHHDELAFREGQLIKVYGEKDGDGFYWGEASGRVGYVPCNMITEVQLGDDRTTTHHLSREDVHVTGGYRQSSSRPARAPQRQWDDGRQTGPRRNWDERRETSQRHWDERRETSQRHWDDRRETTSRHWDDRREPAGRHWDDRRDASQQHRHWDDGRQPAGDSRRWDGPPTGPAGGGRHRQWEASGQPAGAVRRMVALYDYDPHHLSPNVDAEMELSFCTGDVIQVYGDMDDDGFYIGEINGVRGLVPSNFLTDAPQGQGQERRGTSGAASPGPGQLGPPLPPRHRGDSRDRRKDDGGGGGGGGGRNQDPDGRQPRRW